MNNLKSLLGLFFLIAIIWAGCNACSNDSESNKKSPSVAVPEASQEDINRVAEKHSELNKDVLINSTALFKTRINQYFETADMPYHINKIPISDGDVYNTFSIMLAENIAIVGSLNKSENSVREISMIGRGDGTATSGADILLTIGGLITAADPSLEASDKGDIIRKLGLLDPDMDINNLEASTQKNGIKYWVLSSEVIGVSFGATPIGQ